mmetsp:Transcript_33682/g.77719  ORF Transcript_33682/g.77719 Transcript_33682/m.77719 type:complete len:102 (-) Transcript_33682:1027-1332(-)
MRWADGLRNPYVVSGKTARSGSKAKGRQFDRAFECAKIEQSKPVDLRMEWNHGSKTAVELKQKNHVKPLKLSIKNRSGEICFAHAGTNFGELPSFSDCVAI